MHKNGFWLIISTVVLAALVLAACSGATQVLGGQNNTSNQDNQGGQGNTTSGGQGGNGGFGGGGVTADTPLEAKLAVGLLQLEGTNLSVTPAEAKKMLPLWEKVRSDMASFRTSFNATPAPGATPPAEQLQSIYQQIEQTLTPDQLKELQGMAISGAQLRNLMTVLNVTPAAGNFGGFAPGQRATFQAEGTQFPNGGGGNISPEQRATFIAEATQNPNGGFGRNGTRTPRNGTPRAGGGFGGGGFGTTNLFLDPLIKMLQNRAAS